MTKHYAIHTPEQLTALAPYVDTAQPQRFALGNIARVWRAEIVRRSGTAAAGEPPMQLRVAVETQHHKPVATVERLECGRWQTEATLCWHGKDGARDYCRQHLPLLPTQGGRRD